jgi:hypothetical protein
MALCVREDHVSFRLWLLLYSFRRIKGSGGGGKNLHYP